VNDWTLTRVDADVHACLASGVLGQNHVLDRKLKQLFADSAGTSVLSQL
jgi:hypothetical protein